METHLTLPGSFVRPSPRWSALARNDTTGFMILHYVSGTLELRDLSPSVVLPPETSWDPRSRSHRAPASLYSQLVLTLRRSGIPFTDSARAYTVLEHGLQVLVTPRPYQKEAMSALVASGGRGVVVLPTGAGKTMIGLQAIDHYRRSSLVVVPTLDLAHQWFDLLRTWFQVPVGMVGGGDHLVEQLTVITYDSAYLHMEHLGNRFGLVIFDECHHLPGNAYALAARSCLAPYRLGLSATPERSDGRHLDLEQLIGPTVYHRDVVELGDYLAEYRTEQVAVALSSEERRDYEQARSVYRTFLKRQGIRMSGPTGWSDFVTRSSCSHEGRQAMRAFQRQRHLAFAAPSKLAYVDHLLRRHAHDRVLLFTANNEMAYIIARRFLLPIITHQSKVSERSAVLEEFRTGGYTALVTSRVLNEGVDVPEANVAIVISGSGSVREHVQRLGRILRKQRDKRAVLYELIAAGTSEMQTSYRRRDHSAYR